LRTSPATTANPLPCSPARAASTAALSARRFVWKAISFITDIISDIFLLDWFISFIELIAMSAWLLPCDDFSAPLSVSSWAFFEFSAFVSTGAVFSSMV